MKKNVLIGILILALGAAGFFAVSFKLQNNDFKLQEKNYLQKITSLTLNKDMLQKDLDQSMTDYTEAQKKVREGESRYALLNNKCDQSECLFNQSAIPSFPLGLTQVSGYYTQVDQTLSEKTKKCDTFILTEGESSLLTFLKDRSVEQISMTSSSVKGLPFLNIDLADLSLIDRLHLSKSSESQPITLSVFIPMQKNATEPCQSEANILDIK